MPEEVSVTFDPEVDVSDDVVGRSRYERFYSISSNYTRKKYVFEDINESAVEGAFEGFACEVEATKSIKHISKIARSLPKFLIIPVEIMYFVMLSNAFRKRTYKHESERKSFTKQ